MVVILVTLSGPPHGVLGVLIHDDVFVFRGAASIDTSHDVDGTELRQNALVEPFKRGIHLILKQLFIAWIVDDLLSTCNTVFCQIDICHDYINLFLIKICS